MGKHILQRVIDAGIIKCSDIDSNKMNKTIEKLANFSHSKVKRRETFMKKLELGGI